MTIRVALNHLTEYHYDRPVTLGPQVVRLRPAPHSRTPVPAYSFKVTPSKHFLNWQQDPQGNYLARLVFPEKTDRFAVEVDLVAEMTVINPFDFFLEESAFHYPFTYDTQLARELRPFLEVKEPGPLLKAWLAKVPMGRKEFKTTDFLVELNQRLQSELKYLIRLEPGVFSSETTLEKGCGSCRDMAWLLVDILRHLGLAARFVSGYLIQLVADVKPLEGPSGPPADFTDLHAWTEVYLPGAGWVGLDPTSGLLTGEGHIPLAATPDPQSAAPITGALEKCEVEFRHAMKVTRIHEDPRVTKPYTEDQWLSIMDLGHKVDAKLRQGDVRLTMGGEPTFVASDDMESPEWNIEAMGEGKRLRAGELMRRLHKRWAPNGVRHFGLGKWYPGESLPRWALSCYWRRDGQPCWRNQELVADERKNYGYGEREAKSFMKTLADRLGVNGEHMVAGFEDVWYYLWRERRLPTNVDPFDSKLEWEEDRVRLAKIFEQGFQKVVGFALPLQKGFDGWGLHWISGAWFFRPERMYLTPGDSPMGLRLPLDSLPWASPTEYPYILPPDPLSSRSPLPSAEQLRAAQVGARRESSTPGAPGAASQPVLRQDMAAPGTRSGGPGMGDGLDEWRRRMEQRLPTREEVEQRGKSAHFIIRTALCVEPREGRLYIFMPPVRTADHYLELVAAIEDTADELQMPVIIEGYTPPFDPRLNHFKITPDPGVIEVNVPPAETWDELTEIVTGLYDDAFQSRLGTEKFMIDGRHTGTGGGNHIVIGGPTPADSPLLRRPDLLRSLVGYWHNHPSLSYIFSGLFIGPTSQAPRVDEARNDQLYELEIAWKQLDPGGYTPPWLVDRTLRNILVDITGNTHRAEFCIDKLYSPDTATGRLGLLEFRAFEMPPHARMSLAQQLLMRGLIAKFWEKPYDESLVRWGTELHDRFLMPHFVEQDFHDVVRDLNQAGFAFDPLWYAPHLEFRFPVYGTTTQRDIHLELRCAIEPWHVLGEHATAGGAARYVDSSLERLQVKVRGMVDPRYVITCNGHALPLHPTGTVGEYVAGVRYRAWQPPECLHPNIGVHSPLVFDVVDTWNARSMGGCTYHVVHPGGRAFDTFPINAFEAESRRVSRFFKHGHTQGSLKPRPATRSKEFPMTLDLRRL